MSISTTFVILILLYIGYQHNFGMDSDLPTDEEQAGLNDQIVINFSHVVAENTPKGLAANKFAKLVEQKTNGKVKVEVYPNSMLYSDDNEIQALQNGDIQMIAPSFSNLTKSIPEWQVLDLPYIFRDYEDIQQVFTGETSKELLDMLNDMNIKGMAFWSNGFKQMTSNQRPLIHVEDFKGLKVRTMPSDILQQQFTMLKASPSDIGFDKVFSALEKNVIDTEENTISNIYSKGFYKAQKYMTISNHGILGYAVMMNEDFWNSLPKDIQEKIQESIEETTLWNMKQSEKMNKDDLEKIKKDSSLSIYTLPESIQKEWMKKWDPLYQHYEEEINPKLIKQIQHELQQH
ncbi:DctP family TRAP transporter solute-binding subunit [Bacillus massiliigorillae]|uniref:DctP family TRAP transporter solute-binding subunit n=1 Tax=Bacillus massiliigorillae TaxID=1243664 RepID=UPI00039C3404|nr:DctP family TRAP transporter solute-binding subunit [Bacillus massiliigorillae]